MSVPTAPTPPQDRIPWIDVARALGIVLAVFGHSERGLWSAGILHSPAWAQIDFMLYTFHMPLFFYLSGMNAAGSRHQPGFFRRRAMAIVLPYLVFSILQGSIQIALASETNGTLTWKDLLLIPLAPIWPFWFLYVLLVYVGIVSIWKPGRAMMAAAVVMLLLSPLAADVSGAILIFQILHFFVFFVAGALFRAPRVPGWSGMLAAMVWLGGCVIALRMGVPTSSYYVLYMLPAAICGIVALIWVAQRLTDPGGLLAYIGRNVIAIYVMHTLAAAGTRIILMRLGVEAPVIHIGLGVFNGVFLPLLALWVLQKTELARHIGLPARRTQTALKAI